MHVYSMCTEHKASRSNVVGVVTRLGIGRSGARIPAAARDFIFLQTSRKPLSVTQWASQALFLRGTETGSETELRINGAVYLPPISLRGMQTDKSRLYTSKQSYFVKKENYEWLEIKVAKRFLSSFCS